MKLALASLFVSKNAADKSAPSAPEQQVAPGTQIRYDAGLINHFKAHHDTMAERLAAVRTSARNGDYGKALHSVHEFKQLLSEHLLEENLRLYTYLIHCMDDDPAGKERLLVMRKEMSTMARKVMDFMRKYEARGVNSDNAANFLEDLDEVSRSLGERFAREEGSLYPLYRPPAQSAAA